MNQEEVKKIRKIEISARKLSGEAFAGEYKSAFKGRGIYFDEIREYQEGDDVRLIDWTATARFAKPYVKVFKEERQLEIYFAVDISASVNFGSINATKRDICARIAAAIAFAAIENKDKVGLILFTNKIERIIPPKTGRMQVLKIIRDILDFQAQNKKSDLKRSFEQILNLIKKRAYIFILSDFIDLNYHKSLLKIAKSKEAIAIKVYDKIESELSDVGLLELIDSESGEVQILDSSDERLRTYWRAMNNYYISEFEKSVKSAGIDYLILESRKPFINALAELFIKRKKRR